MQDLTQYNKALVAFFASLITKLATQYGLQLDSMTSDLLASVVTSVVIGYLVYRVPNKPGQPPTSNPAEREERESFPGKQGE